MLSLCFNGYLLFLFMVAYPQPSVISMTQAAPFTHYVRLGGVDFLRVVAYAIFCCKGMSAGGAKCMFTVRGITLLIEAGCNIYDV